MPTIIECITQAEAKGAELKKQAAARAKEITDDAEARRGKTIKEAHDAGRAMIQRAKDEAEKQGAALAAELLKDHEYETLNLTDYTIGAYGQNLPGDGLDTVIGAMKQADTIVIGSPLYWHNICGSVRNVLDRFYGKVEDGELSGRKLYFVFQGAAPEKWMLEAGEYTMKRFAALYGMAYGGMVTNKAEAVQLNKEV